MKTIFNIKLYLKIIFILKIIKFLILNIIY